jgi:hypothetical protein
MSQLRWAITNERPMSQSQKCTELTASGTPCKAWAVHGTDPPRCAAHGGGKAPVGAPPGNRNAETHGFYSQPRTDARSCVSCVSTPASIDDIFNGLAEKQAQLDRYITDNLPDLDAEVVIKLLGLYAQNASRLSRILRDRAAITGETADELDDAISEALRLASHELGVDLT